MRPGIIVAVVMCFGAMLRADTGPPTISSIDPAVLVSSASPKLMTLTGSNFIAGMSVSLVALNGYGSLAAHDVTVVSETKITFTVQYQPTAKLAVYVYLTTAGYPQPHALLTITPVLSDATPIIVTEGEFLGNNEFASVVHARVTPGSTAFLFYGGIVPALPGTYLNRVYQGYKFASDDDGDGIVQFQSLPFPSGQVVFFVVDSTGVRKWIRGPLSDPLPETTMAASVELGADGLMSRVTFGVSYAGGLLWVRPNVGAWFVSVTDGGTLDADIPGLGNGYLNVLTKSFGPIGNASPAAPGSFQPSDILVLLNPTRDLWWTAVLPSPLAGTPGNGTIQPFTGGIYYEGDVVHAYLERHGGADGPISVDYETLDGSAIAGQNYVTSSGTVTFARGEFLKSFSIPTIDDGVYDSSKNFTVRLTPHGTSIEGGETNPYGSNTMPVYVHEGDPPPSLSISDVRVDEGDTGIRTVNVPITLSGPTHTSASVQWSTQDKGGFINFAPGEASKTIAINYTANTTPDPDRHVTITLTNPSSATISRATAVVTIVDDDTPHLSVNDINIPEHSGTATFYVSLESAAKLPVTVQYATSDGTATAPLDYEATSGMLTFAPGETTRSVIVPIVADDLVEDSETFSLTLSKPTGGGSIVKGTGIATIIDAGAALPLVLIANIQVKEGNSGFTDATFNVTLSVPSSTPVLLSWETRSLTAASDDYVSASGTLVFAPGEISKKVTVQLIGDTIPEPDELIRLNVTSAIGAVAGDGAICTILDDDSAPSLPPRHRASRH